MAEHMLSTVDNPWNPFTHFDEWFAYDSLCQYDTLGFLARIVITSDDLSEYHQSQAIETAIEEIVRENVTGLYIKVTADTDVSSRFKAAS